MGVLGGFMADLLAGNVKPTGPVAATAPAPILAPQPAKLSSRPRAVAHPLSPVPTMPSQSRAPERTPEAPPVAYTQPDIGRIVVPAARAEPLRFPDGLRLHLRGNPFDEMSGKWFPHARLWVSSTLRCEASATEPTLDHVANAVGGQVRRDLTVVDAPSLADRWTTLEAVTGVVRREKLDGSSFDCVEGWLVATDRAGAVLGVWDGAGSTAPSAEDPYTVRGYKYTLVRRVDPETGEVVGRTLEAGDGWSHPSYLRLTLDGLGVPESYAPAGGNFTLTRDELDTMTRAVQSLAA